MLSANNIWAIIIGSAAVLIVWYSFLIGAVVRDYIKELKQNKLKRCTQFN